MQRADRHSACSDVPLPPSLVNVFQEINADMAVTKRHLWRVTHCKDKPVVGKGCLEPWAKQGVLLLNAALTIAHEPAENGKSKSCYHRKHWECFTNRVVQVVNCRPPVVFLLWGEHARKKHTLVSGMNKVLEATHPSPLSAAEGFFGCRHFSKANQYLVCHGRKPIDWFAVA